MNPGGRAESRYQPAVCTRKVTTILTFAVELCWLCRSYFFQRDVLFRIRNFEYLRRRNKLAGERQIAATTELMRWSKDEEWQTCTQALDFEWMEMA